MAQSVSMAKSARYDQSIPMAQSASPVMLTYDDQSMPKDSSVPNGLSADNLNPLKPVQVNNWVLHTGPNSNMSAFQMKVESTLPWKVDVYDAEGKSTPKGYLAEYSSSGYNGGKHLSLPIQVQSESGTKRDLSGDPQTIQTGDHTYNNHWFDINLYQYIVSSDTPLSTGETYHIVITFRASNNY